MLITWIIIHRSYYPIKWTQAGWINRCRNLCRFSTAAAIGSRVIFIIGGLRPIGGHVRKIHMCLPVDLIFEVPIGWEKLPNEIKHLLQHKMEIATIWAAKCQRRSYQRRRGLAASGSMKATLG
jgi:hypothetical protein